LVAVSLQTVDLAMADVEFEVRMVESTYDPGWEFPYHFEYEMEVTVWDPAVDHINDFHFAWPVVDPGGLRIVAPEGWVGEEHFDGSTLEIGFLAEDEESWMNEAGTLGGWRIEGQNPELVETGEAYLTEDGQPVSGVIPASFPVGPRQTPAVSSWGLVVTVLLALAAGVVLLRKRQAA
jgi:hypothetical protein